MSENEQGFGQSFMFMVKENTMMNNNGCVESPPGGHQSIVIDIKNIHNLI